MAANGDIYEMKVVCYHTTDQQVGINILHYQVSNLVGTGPTELQICTALDVLIAAAYKGWLQNNAQYRGVAGNRVFPLPKTVGSFTNATAGAGTGGATGLPLQVSGLIQTRAGFAGRKYRGRIYPPFPPTAFSDANGQMNGTGTTALAAIRTAIPNTYAVGAGPNTAQMNHVVYHRATHSVDAVLSYFSIGQWATQRRRGQLGKTNLLPF